MVANHQFTEGSVQLIGQIRHKATRHTKAHFEVPSSSIAAPRILNRGKEDYMMLRDIKIIIVHSQHFTNTR